MMSEHLITTKIPYRKEYERLLKAFLYGVIHSSYKILVDPSTDFITIHFENGEDATVFKLSDLGKTFRESFIENRKYNDAHEIQINNAMNSLLRRDS